MRASRDRRDGFEIPSPKRFRRAGNAGGIVLHLEDASLATRYMGIVVRGVKVGPSPQWLVDRLAAVGSRSINNVVDATNYVLHELGQPTHAFDLAKFDLETKLPAEDGRRADGEGGRDARHPRRRPARASRPR